MNLALSITAIKRKLYEADWGFIRGSTQLSLWLAVARVLGLAFSLVLARVFSPGDYGVIQYAITLATLISIGTEPFGMHVIAQYVARQKEHADQLGRTLTNIAIIQIAVFGFSIFLFAPLIWWQMRSLTLGILIIFLGQTVFYTYWGLARGFLAPNRLAAAYLGSNLVQIVLVIILIGGLGIHSTQLALVIYGASYFLPLALLQYYWPLSINLNISLLNKKYISQILKFSTPIWLSQVGFVLFSVTDILLLEHFSGSVAVGVYRLNKIITMAFIFIPQGIASILLPKVAASSKEIHGKLLKRSLSIVLLVDAIILFFYLLLLQPFVQAFLGSGYLIDFNIALVLALGSMMIGIDAVVVSVLVGKGRPGIETFGRTVSLIVAVIAGLYLIPIYGIFGAALTVLMGTLSSLFTYVLFGLISSASRGVQL
jgi:O-antigen/teichoic acid export membrane protein